MFSNINIMQGSATQTIVLFSTSNICKAFQHKSLIWMVYEDHKVLWICTVFHQNRRHLYWFRPRRIQLYGFFKKLSCTVFRHIKFKSISHPRLCIFFWFNINLYIRRKRNFLCFIFKVNYVFFFVVFIIIFAVAAAVIYI